MSIKKIIAFFLTIAAVVLLASCGNEGYESENTSALEVPSASVSNTSAPDKGSESSTESFTEEAQPVNETTSGTTSSADKFSSKKIEHSYGIAKDSKPHLISVNNQKFFEENGFKAVCLDTKTTKKVLYLTFDCGWENGYTAKLLDVLKDKNVPAAFFCTLDHLKAEPELIKRMIAEGHIIGNHSATHRDFSTLSRAEIDEDIGRCAQYMKDEFSYTSKYFRFPEGSYSERALDEVGKLGYLSVFWSCSYADWDVNAQKGADYAAQTVTSRLHPGAVILLHAVSPDNTSAMGRIIDWARAQGYEFKSLDALPY